MSSSKFRSHCGWPSFDDQVPGSVKQFPDADGIRTEILCAACDAHLGHIFLGEGFTEKNTRYCVNSIAMEFAPEKSTALNKPPAEEIPTEAATFASGCFWGTQYYLAKAPGVLSSTVGYTGGHVPHPSYKQVCTGTTGHAEAVQIVFDPAQTSYEQLAVLFFETHDFTQLNRQGPDIGPQYRSAIFYQNEAQRLVAKKLIDRLKQKGCDVKTELAPAAAFYPAEEYHQDYYQKNGQTPYCHRYRRVF
jgi:peptide methionine sulfoxide reductase msrA/msrB